jgi:sRNA-binding protein
LEVRIIKTNLKMEQQNKISSTPRVSRFAVGDTVEVNANQLEGYLKGKVVNETKGLITVELENGTHIETHEPLVRHDR